MGILKEFRTGMEKVSSAIDNSGPLMTRGNELMKKGDALIEKGPPLMDQGSALMVQGRALIDQGSALMNKGNVLLDGGAASINELHEALVVALAFLKKADTCMDAATAYYAEARQNLALEREQLQLQIADLKRGPQAKP